MPLLIIFDDSVSQNQPYDYVMKISRKIIDVAFACGFESVDGYQRAFLREFGCNPKEYALNPVPLSFIHLPFWRG